MALSRIWSAFIIVAIAVASIKYLSSNDYKSVYNDMIVGKSGDTIQIGKKNLTLLSPIIRDSIAKNPNYQEDRIHYNKKEGSEDVKIYRIQSSDGVISTSKTAVDICIGLIGIMTLFMGFMSIAEKAGGINFLSRLIQPFSRNYFRKFQKVTLLLVI